MCTFFLFIPHILSAEVFMDIRKQYMKEALTGFVREELKTNRYGLSADQWVNILNCYAGRKEVGYCSAMCRISPGKASRIYNRLSREVIRHALRN